MRVSAGSMACTTQPSGPGNAAVPPNHPAQRPRHRIQFRRTPIPALEGETIAAALSAAGIVAFRRTASGAPRGLHCGMGACFDCVVTVDGRIGQRACMTKVADGMVVTGDATLPLAPLGAEPAARSRGAASATCWWSAPVRPGCRRRSPRPRPARRRGAGRAQRHRRAIRQAAGRQPRGRRAGCAVPPRDGLARARAGGRRARSRPTQRSGAASPPTRSPPWCAAAR